MEYRITRPNQYPEGHPGHTDLDVRQDWFVNANTPDKARADFRKRFGKKLKLREGEKLDVQGRDRELVVSKDAQAKVTTFDDSAFVRTAIVAGTGGEDGEKNGFSIDVVDEQGQRLCEINLTVVVKDWESKHADREITGIICDVIDVDNRFGERKAVVFPRKGHAGKHTKAGTLVSADFRVKT